MIHSALGVESGRILLTGLPNPTLSSDQCKLVLVTGLLFVTHDKILSENII